MALDTSCTALPLPALFLPVHDAPSGRAFTFLAASSHSGPRSISQPIRDAGGAGGGGRGAGGGASLRPKGL